MYTASSSFYAMNRHKGIELCIYSSEKKKNTNMFTTVNLKVHSESNLNIYLPKDIQTDIHVFFLINKDKYY